MELALFLLGVPILSGLGKTEPIFLWCSMSTEVDFARLSTRHNASRFFRAAALLNLTAIPGHHLTGLISVFPALRGIPDIPQHAVGQRAATIGWDFLHSFFFVKGMFLHLGVLINPINVKGFTKLKIQPCSTTNGVNIQDQERKRKNG